MQRQEVLSKNDPPHLWCVIDEGVVHRRIGGRKVMHDQLIHLAEMSEQPKVSVQVVPFEVFDTLRSEALPRGASRDLIMKVAEERWTD
jgi:hypothetical protein